MIYGVGTDIVSVDRIETIYQKMSQRFLEKILSPLEIENFKTISSQNSITFLASRWAAKEAVVKALGVGFTNGIYLPDITISKNPLGKPVVILSESSEKSMLTLLLNQNVSTNFNIHLSLSHEQNYAVAFAIVELI